LWYWSVDPKVFRRHLLQRQTGCCYFQTSEPIVRQHNECVLV
jgi:hypothetical protein